jgi:hypothetical protein
MYSSTLTLTSALDEGGWSTPLPGRFALGKETLHSLYRRLGWLEDVWKGVENLAPTGIRSQDSVAILSRLIRPTKEKPNI